MLDTILREDIVKNRPGYAFALGIMFATIGLAMATLIFKGSPSFPAIFLTAMAATQVLARFNHKLVGKNILEKYGSLISIYSYLFFGMAVAFALWFAILPEAFTSMLFKEQLLKFTAGYFTFQVSDFLAIVINNTGLTLFFFLLSLFYGSGSMFLISWNASILGVMWGNAIRGAFAVLHPGQFIVNTISAFPYLLPEVGAYFLAAIAGGILSINIAKKNEFDVSIKEALVLLVVAIGLIIVSGAIEAVILGF